jgi:hypothetical protein
MYVSTCLIKINFTYGHKYFLILHKVWTFYSKYYLSIDISMQFIIFCTGHSS